ncbi:MAG: transcription factor S [Nanoarchaeota archaeon]|nr:transcription factor S [Nanoarchaeota archaeon]
MDFCESCGSLLLPDKNRKKLVCSSCGKSAKTKGSVIIKEELKTTGKGLEVVDKDLDINPEIEAECPKCEHKKAKFWTLQTRASDEPETRFFECIKCRHRWREY